MRWQALALIHAKGERRVEVSLLVPMLYVGNTNFSQQTFASLKGLILGPLSLEFVS